MASLQSGLPETIGISSLYLLSPWLILTIYRLKQWVSVKIARADKTNRSRELQNLRALAQYSNTNPGAGYIVQLLDDFIHEGPNGSHQCLIFELLGPTVSIEVDHAHYFKKLLDTSTIIRISTQMLEAIAFMHEVSYTHGGMVIYGCLTLYL